MTYKCRSACLAATLLLSLCHEAVAQQPVAPAPAVPPVVLSEQHKKLTKAGVGDALPALELTTLEGQAQSLPELYGKRATVLLFWQGNGWMTRAALRDLGPDIAKPFGEKGVAVVTIAVGQPAPETRQILEQVKSQVPTLLDADGTAFAEVGSQMLPRVYVLDDAGKIVWFDLEYSNATRRELRQAVEALAGN